MGVKSRDINLQGIETLEMADGSIKKITPEMRIAAQATFDATGGFGSGGVSAEELNLAVTNHAGLPTTDVGATYLHKGQIPCTKVSNGEQYSYIVNPGTQLYPEILNDGYCSDTVTTLQALGVINIPGGSIVHNTRARLLVRLDCSDASGTAAAFGSTSSRLYIRLIGQGLNDTTNPTLYMNVTSTSATSVVLDTPIFSFISNVLHFQSTSLTAYSDNRSKRINLLSNFQIEVGYQHSGASTGRIITLTETGSDRARLEIYPTTKLFNTTVGLRKPTEQPFRDDSFWNVPLPASATYAAIDDPITAAITGYGQPGSPVGNDYGGKIASSYAYVQGRNGGGLSLWYMRDTDPWTLLYYDRRQQSGAPWPFPATNSNPFVPGTIYLKLPKSQLPVGQNGDEIALLITPDKRYCIEAGHVVWNESLQRHEVGAISCIDLLGSGMTTRNISPYSSIDIQSALPAFQEAYRAAGLPIMGGAIRASDCAAGVIRHVVGLQLSFSQQRASVFKVVTQTGTLFEIVPSRDTEYPRLDYSSMFTAGTVVYHGGSTYTIASDATWSSSTNRTSFNVLTTISTTNSTLTLGGIAGSNGIGDRQFVWPATTKDAASNSTSGGTLISSGYHGIVPVGAFFAIPKSVDLNALGLTPGGLMLAKAYQDYGCINTDTASNTFGMCQIDTDVLANYLSIVDGIGTDRHTIKQLLRRVTNYDRNLVRAGLLDKTVQRPAKLLSLY